MSRPVAVICVLLVGVLAALQPAANASFSKLVGDLGAAFSSLVISAIFIGVLLVAVGHPGRLSGLGSIKPEHVLGGFAGAAIVTVTLIAVRSLGAGTLVSLFVTAQLIVGGGGGSVRLAGPSSPRDQRDAAARNRACGCRDDPRHPDMTPRGPRSQLRNN